MKLKTLKDIETQEVYPIVDSSILKEEAIKWMKEGITSINDWRYFFNITKEDLNET